MTSVGIYVHVPFCAVKCPYCDFYSEKFSMAAAKKYTAAVIRNIMAYPSEIPVDTIYFGGGTPSILPETFIEQIIDALYSHFSINNAEITLEANPKTVNFDKLLNLHNIGINRLSLGVQSCNDNELKLLGRKHCYSDVIFTVENAVKAGFQNISCDLMIGIMNQNMSSLEYSLTKLASLQINHISAYILKVEENTLFNNANIINSLPNEDVTSDMYLFMVDFLEKHGFMQYEISNFAKNNFESKHNTKYWNCTEYIGFGPAAHSYFNGKRYCVNKNLDEFISLERQSKFITDDSAGSDEERLMLGLRLKKGICIDDFPTLKVKLLKLEEPMISNGYINITNGILSLTPKGFLLSNSIISSLI